MNHSVVRGSGRLLRAYEVLTLKPPLLISWFAWGQSNKLNTTMIYDPFVKRCCVLFCLFTFPPNREKHYHSFNVLSQNGVWYCFWFVYKPLVPQYSLAQSAAVRKEADDTSKTEPKQQLRAEKLKQWVQLSGEDSPWVTSDIFNITQCDLISINWYNFTGWTCGCSLDAAVNLFVYGGEIQWWSWGEKNECVTCATMIFPAH